MTITAHGKRESRGRPPIDEIPLPPHVQRALTLRSGGASWKAGQPQWIWTTER